MKLPKIKSRLAHKIYSQRDSLRYTERQCRIAHLRILILDEALHGRKLRRANSKEIKAIRRWKEPPEWLLNMDPSDPFLRWNHLPRHRKHVHFHPASRRSQ